ncbi:MAG TPA: hypothetical protein VFW07_28100 [Parafilimonas sp.]|nr:hypothetical protein [Parafilimonas sp.]
MKQLSIVTHLSAAIIITVVMLLIYACAQQSYHSTANDPQLQIARDLSDDLSNVKSGKQFLDADTIDIAKSLAVFTALFDAAGKPIQSTGLLDGKLPLPPEGIFEFAGANMENVLTWQPRPGVRMAMVFEKIKEPGQGFVAAGRSLKEVEIREGNLVKMIGLAWAACLGVLLVNLSVQLYYRKVTTKKQMVYEN